MALSKEDLDDLQSAKNILENPGLAARVTALRGTPTGKGFECWPANMIRSIADIAGISSSRSGWHENIHTKPSGSNISKSKSKRGKG